MMFSAVLFPVCLSLCFVLTVGYYSVHGEMFSPIPLVGGAVSALAATVLGQRVFQTLKRGIEADPVNRFAYRRGVLAACLSLVTCLAGIYGVLASLDGYRRANREFFGLKHARQEVLNASLKLDRLNQTRQQTPPTSEPAWMSPPVASDWDLQQAKDNLQKWNREVRIHEGAGTRTWLCVPVSLLFLLGGLAKSFSVVRQGGASLSTSLSAPTCSILMVGGLLIAFALDRHSRTSVEAPKVEVRLESRSN